MTTAKPRSLGMIGAGFIAQVAHLPAFQRLPECRIAAIADNRPDLLESVARSHGIPQVFADYRAMLGMADLDAVIVAVPRRAQSAIVREVLNARRSVLTEKPMAYTVQVADELVALSRSNDIEIMVGYMRLYDPGVRLFQALLQEAIEGGEMGAMLHIRMSDFCGAYTVPVPDHVRYTGKRPCRYPEDPSKPDFLESDLQADYDYTINVMSHDIDLLRVLFGNLQPVSFRVLRGGAQHAVFGAHGVDAAVSAGPAAVGEWEQRIDVYFRKGSLSLCLDCPLTRQSCGTVLRRRPAGEETLRPALSGQWSAFDLQAEGFLDLLRHGRAVAAEGADAKADLETIESMWRIASIGP